MYTGNAEVIRQATKDDALRATGATRADGRPPILPSAAPSGYIQTGGPGAFQIGR